ncbi:MAG: hypothetical protein H6Q04_1412 [Acidobacteria bacterium]|jgi:hypothetical protein|nr:hypothetical protein [Acidobacteriota bacterium]
MGLGLLASFYSETLKPTNTLYGIRVKLMEIGPSAESAMKQSPGRNEEAVAKFNR